MFFYDINLHLFFKILEISKNFSSVEKLNNSQIKSELKRMYENDYISGEEFERYTIEPIKTHLHKDKNIFSSDYYLEVIRQQIIDTFGEKYLYSGGLSVRTSLDTEAQFQADTALKEGLLAYDKRYGYRGVIKNDQSDNWLNSLKDIDLPYNFQFAKVISKCL